MNQHLDEMQNYIRIAGTNLFENREDEQAPINSEIVKENSKLPSSVLLEELNDIVFKLRSYNELSEDQKYALGVEEGLSKAAEMITNFIDRHSNK